MLERERAVSMHSSRVNTLGIGETIWVKIKTVVRIEVHPDMFFFLILTQQYDGAQENGD